LTCSYVVAAGSWANTERPRCPLETSIPGLLSGGSIKRVGFAVGDGSLAATCRRRRALTPITLSDAVPGPSISKVAQKSPNPDRLP